MHLRVKKLNLDIFTRAPGKILAQVQIITPRQREFTPLPQDNLFEKPFPQQKVSEETMILLLTHFMALVTFYTPCKSLIF